jgi:hypothetical protein
MHHHIPLQLSLLWLGSWCALASPPEKQANLDPHQYEKACPDYKKYATFKQYVMVSRTAVSANHHEARLSPQAQWLWVFSDPRSIVGHLVLP